MPRFDSCWVDVTNTCTQTRACVFREIAYVSVRDCVCVCACVCACVCVCVCVYKHIYDIGKYNNSTMQKITNVHTCINDNCEV